MVLRLYIRTECGESSGLDLQRTVLKFLLFILQKFKMTNCTEFDLSESTANQELESATVGGNPCPASSKLTFMILRFT